MKKAKRPLPVVSVILIAIAALFYFSNQTSANNKKTEVDDLDYQKDEVLVKFKNKNLKEKEAQQTIKTDKDLKANLKKQTAENIGKDTPLEKKKKGLSKQIYKVKTKKDARQAARKIKNNPQVEFAEPNYRLKIKTTPNDPQYSSQWYLRNVDLPQAWSIGRGSTSTVIAVVDTGVDWNHPDLSSNIWSNPGESNNGNDSDSNGYVDDIRGWDFVTQTSCYGGEECDGSTDNNPMDFHGHGTAVTGVASADANNGTGIAGAGWRVKIMAVRAGYARSGDGQGELLVSDTVNAIEYAADNGADIINASWGGSYSSSIAQAVNYAYRRDCLFIAAAGNGGDNDRIYPAALDKVIAVGGTKSNGHRWASSNYGYWVNIAAPAKSIRTTVYNNNYTTSSGTSLSAPLVSGIAGLIKSKHPSLGRKRLAERVINSAEGIKADGIGNKINARNGFRSRKRHPTGTLIRQKNKPSVYYIQGKKRLGIRTAKMFKTQFRWKDVVNVSKSEKNSYNWGGYFGFKEGTLVRPKNKGTVFIIDDGERRAFANKSTFKYYGYKWKNVIEEKNSALKKAHPRGNRVTKNTGYPDGTLLRRNGGGTVFAIKDGKRWPITSPTALKSHKFKWRKVVETKNRKIKAIGRGGLYLHDDGTLIRKKGSGTVYYLQAGFLRKFASAKRFKNLGYKWKRVYNVPKKTFNKYKRGLLPNM